jgi:hypothetical protein
MRPDVDADRMGNHWAIGVIALTIWPHLANNFIFYGIIAILG